MNDIIGNHVTIESECDDDGAIMEVKENHVVLWIDEKTLYSTDEVHVYLHLTTRESKKIKLVVPGVDTLTFECIIMVGPIDRFKALLEDCIQSDGSYVMNVPRYLSLYEEGIFIDGYHRSPKIHDYLSRLS